MAIFLTVLKIIAFTILVLLLLLIISLLSLLLLPIKYELKLRYKDKIFLALDVRIGADFCKCTPC